MKYRKKPVVIEASQWNKHGDHPSVVPLESGHIPKNGDGSSAGFIVGTRNLADYGWIETLEGGHIVTPGDFIITGVKGEMCPCKPDIFAATYEPEQSTPPVPPRTFCSEEE